MESGQAAAWNRQFIVSWAEPQDEPDEETMAKVFHTIYMYNTVINRSRLIIIFFASSR